MKIAEAAEDSGDETIVLFRPVTAMQLGNALNRKPFKVIQDLLEINYFVNLQTEIEDDCLLAYSRTADFEFRLFDRK